jgi:hypothetical protein
MACPAYVAMRGGFASAAVIVAAWAGDLLDAHGRAAPWAGADLRRVVEEVYNRRRRLSAA